MINTSCFILRIGRFPFRPFYTDNASEWIFIAEGDKLTVTIRLVYTL